MKQLHPKWSRHIFQVAIASKRRKGRSTHDLGSRFCFATRVIPPYLRKHEACEALVRKDEVLQPFRPFPLCSPKLQAKVPPPSLSFAFQHVPLCYLGEKQMHLQTKHARYRVPILQVGEGPHRKRGLLAVTNRACGRMKMRRGKRECVCMEQASACIPSLPVLVTCGHAQHWSSSCVYPSSSVQRMERRGSIGTGVPLPQAFRSASFLSSCAWACWRLAFTLRPPMYVFSEVSPHPHFPRFFVCMV